MNRTKIEYLDYTWNPIVGCSGDGCAVRQRCWAYAMAKRQKHRCDACYSFVPHVHWERFDQPFQVKKPSRIGVAFMGEFFDREIAENVSASLLIKMEEIDWHTFLILTKQPQNIDSEDYYPRNVWLGVSVNQKEDLWRINTLKQVEAIVKFVSFEPLYEDLSMANLEGINWIVIGAQTRPDVQPKREWVKFLLDKAEKMGIPVFLKPNLREWRWLSKQQFPDVALRMETET